MTGLFQDVKFGLRMMARNPWFTFVAALTLALGIGVNGVGFSIANGIWWKRLPFRNPQEIVNLVMTDGTSSADMAGLSFPELNDFRVRARSFKNLAAIEQIPMVLSNEGNASERYSGGRITPNLFAFMGAKPILGRDFIPDDAKPGAPQVVLISDEIWQSRFAGSEDVVGRTVRIDAVPATIVGIMPPGFKFPFNQKIWTPLGPKVSQARYVRSLDVFARLAPGVSIQEARSEVKVIAQALLRDHPATNKGYEAVVLPFMEWVNGPEENTPVLMLIGAAGFVLLIACGNVANLLLSRAVQRSREISVRVSLGAGRWRIIRQVLVESVMLSLLGGFFGLILAEGGIRWLDYIVRGFADLSGMPFWMTFEMDYRVLGYFLATCLATAIGFGTLPAIHISKTKVMNTLKEGANQITGGFRARRAVTALLVAEIAMTVVLLAQAGLLARGLLRVTNLELGVNTRNLLDANVALPSSKYPKESDRIAFVETLMERLKRPDVSSTVAWSGLFDGAAYQQLKLQDRDIADKSGTLPYIGTLPVEKKYFPTLDIAIIRGRDFEDRDGHPGSEVAIVNERFAETYWPNENPLGKRLRLGGEKAPWLRVIGVSPDVFQAGNIQKGPNPIVYVPYRQNPASNFSILLRARQTTESTVAQLRAEVAAIDPDLALYDVMTFEELMRRWLWMERVFGTILAIVAVMALVMSSVGLYGVAAHGVSQRTREIGIRAALGATPFGVVWLILQQSLKCIIAGLVLGLLGAALLGDFVKEVLFAGVESTDPLTFFTISMVLAVVTVIACSLPAWRASKLNPSDALRVE
jgi:putative ABC transport system permease protein